MSFTDQLPRIADVNIIAKWGGLREAGKRFRCYLCGHKFTIGDQWRWICSSPINFLTCESCDGEDIKQRFLALCDEWKSIHHRFWWKLPEQD